MFLTLTQHRQMQYKYEKSNLSTDDNFRIEIGYVYCMNYVISTPNHLQQLIKGVVSKKSVRLCVVSMVIILK